MPSTAFNYEIVEKVAVLSQSGDTTKELNRVSYNGSPAKYDLRSWRRSIATFTGTRSLACFLYVMIQPQ